MAKKFLAADFTKASRALRNANVEVIGAFIE